MRKVLFWMHLAAGVLISALVLFFSITGSLLAYERQLIQAADKHFYQPAALPQNGAPLPLNILIANAMTVVPEAVEMVTMHPDARLPVEMAAANRSVYLVDRYSGKVQGPMSPRVRAFFAEVTALHRWFGLSNAHHATATAVKGAATLLLLFLLLSGAVLWVPGLWTRSSLQRGIVPRFDAGGRARNYNWHKAAGFWTILPLGVVVTTGVIMAYPWANAQLFRLAGSPVPVRRGQENANGRHHGRDAHPLPAHLDEAFAEATRGVDDWQTAALRLPTNGPGMNFTVDRGDGGRPDKREQVVINAKTLVLVHREPFAAMSRGQRWRARVRFTHTGEAGGWWGESLALMAAAGAIVLSITGVLLSLDRLRRWRREANRRTVGALAGSQQSRA